MHRNTDHLHKRQVFISKIPVVDTARLNLRVRKEDKMPCKSTGFVFLQVRCCAAFCSPDDEVTDKQLIYWVVFKGYLSLLVSLKARKMLPTL